MTCSKTRSTSVTGNWVPGQTQWPLCHQDMGCWRSNLLAAAISSKIIDVAKTCLELLKNPQNISGRKESGNWRWSQRNDRSAHDFLRVRWCESDTHPVQTVFHIFSFCVPQDSDMWYHSFLLSHTGLLVSHVISRVNNRPQCAMLLIYDVP